MLLLQGIIREHGTPLVVYTTDHGGILADQEILASWARTVEPPDRYRWDMRPEMDYLEDPR